MKSIVNTEFLENFATHSCIVHESGLNSIHNFLSKVNIDMTDLWGYEIHLGKNQHECDFQFCINKYQATKLHECLATGAFHPFNWRKLGMLIYVWQQATDFPFNSIENIWIEMDKAEMIKQVPQPNFFFAPAKTMLKHQVPILVENVFSSMQVDIHPGTISMFAKCNELLPSNAWISQIGMMLARNDYNLRLFVQDIDQQDVVTYLNKLGWRFNTELPVMLETLYEYVDQINLDMDIQAEIQPVIGLECYFKEVRKEELNGLLNFLQKRNWITTSKKMMILNYFEELKKPASGFYKEFFHHFKIKFNPFGNHEAKFYPGIRKDYAYGQHLLNQLFQS